MNRLWTVALALGIGVGVSACGKKANTSGRDTAGMRDTGGKQGMQGMPGMQGMGSMEGMERGAGDSTAAGSAVPVDRAGAGRLGITFARAAVRPLGRETRVVGTLAYAEPRRAYVNARVMGWVERLYADYMGKPVQKGDPLLALYSPELVSAQEEYLAARRLGDESLTAAARRRLDLWNIPEDQVDSLERTGKARRTIVLRAPIVGRDRREDGHGRAGRSGRREPVPHRRPERALGGSGGVRDGRTRRSGSGCPSRSRWMPCRAAPTRAG